MCDVRRAAEHAVRLNRNDTAVRPLDDISPAVRGQVAPETRIGEHAILVISFPARENRAIPINNQDRYFTAFGESSQPYCHRGGCLSTADHHNRIVVLSQGHRQVLALPEGNTVQNPFMRWGWMR